MEKKHQIELEHRIAVRFFAVSDLDAAISVLPDHAIEGIIFGKYPGRILYYVNVPSRPACFQIAYWAARFHSKLAGCFVTENEPLLDESWNEFQRKFNPKGIRDDTHVEPPSDSNFRVICDVANTAAQTLVYGEMVYRVALTMAMNGSIIHFQCQRKADHTVPNREEPSGNERVFLYPLIKEDEKKQRRLDKRHTRTFGKSIRPTGPTFIRLRMVIGKLHREQRWKIRGTR